VGKTSKQLKTSVQYTKCQNQQMNQGRITFRSPRRAPDMIQNDLKSMGQGNGGSHQPTGVENCVAQCTPQKMPGIKC